LKELDWTAARRARILAGMPGEETMTAGLTRRALLAAALVLTPLTAQARSAEIYTGWLSSSAVGGYDPVAYFTEGRPVAGNSSFTHQWKGATWRFASAKNRDLFKASPEKYAPQYGGYCAWAVSQGYTAKGDPNHWKVVDGKLYLNYDAGVQKNWEKDVPGHIGNANRNWPKVLEK
jgi:YHS domain-containing protein